jgi:CRISPR-associated protein Cas4
VASGSVDVPDLVPARMVNEFVYCPRLFFLEWVQARFEDNLDTVQGRSTHRVVDQPGGAAPLPEDEEPLRVARSLQLSSNELGVVAKADLVEGSPDGEAVPVDYKKGSPPDNAERSWLPERVQLCIVGLLLREHGYRCSHGFLYFAEVRQRVKVDFDEDLVSTTLGLLQELRATAAADVPPPPLIGSPKCPRCSLVGLCLPDETNALAGRSERPPRRLLPHGGVDVVLERDRVVSLKQRIEKFVLVNRAILPKALAEIVPLKHARDGHLGHQLDSSVGPRTNLDHEVRAEREKFLGLLVGHGRQSLAGNPGRVRSEDGAVG